MTRAPTIQWVLAFALVLAPAPGPLLAQAAIRSTPPPVGAEPIRGVEPAPGAAPTVRFAPPALIHGFGSGSRLRIDSPAPLCSTGPTPVGFGRDANPPSRTLNSFEKMGVTAGVVLALAATTSDDRRLSGHARRAFASVGLTPMGGLIALLCRDWPETWTPVR